MKKKKYDILVKIKKINKSKLVNNLNNLNSEKGKLEDIKDYLEKTLKSSQPSSEEISGVQLRQISYFNEELIKKLEVSKNRYRHLNNEINSNLEQINKIEKQREKIISKKRKIERIEIEALENKKEIFRNKISPI
jgi:DNA repair exonuclease SbcCD ATPase subunit